MKVTFADRQTADMTPFRRFRFEERTYILFLDDEDGEPFLLFEENGVYYPAPDEAVKVLLPDLADMLEGFSHFSCGTGEVTILE